MTSHEPSGAARRGDALGMDVDEMRALGQWVLDTVVDYVASGDAGPVVAAASPAELRARLGGPVPRERGDATEAMSSLVDVAFANMQHSDHPRYFARVPSPSSFAAVLGDWLASGFNAVATSWAGGSGPTVVELVVVDWLIEMLGLAPGTEGILTSGGSMGNLTGILVARSELGPGVVYLSDQAHSSNVRGVRALGFAPEEIRVLASDRRFKLDPGELSAAIESDVAIGLHPCVVVASAGTTNTGTVDDLDELADVCARHEVWLHVDGAYGAPAALCSRGRAELVGLHRADSLVLDPHKWLFQPYDIGCLFVRRPGALQRSFAMTPEYLVDTLAESDEVDLRDRTLELTRRARAVKLWLTFRTYGADAIAAAVTRGIELAEHAQRTIESNGRLRLVTPAQLGVVTFTVPDASAARLRRAAAELAEGGFAAVTSTTLHDTPVLRLCTINPTTTLDDIDATIERLDALLVDAG